jgi:hypothetical protein
MKESAPQRYLYAQMPGKDYVQFCLSQKLLAASTPTRSASTVPTGS